MPDSPTAAGTDWPRGVVAPAKSTRLAPLLEPGERVLWTGSPDTRAAMRKQMGLWWIGVPWTVIAAVLQLFGVISGEIGLGALIVGGVLLVSPLLMAAYAGGTIYALTDRRAILKHDALGKTETVSVAFEDMDEEPAILPTGRDTGHVYIASGLPSALSDADYDGRLAFRHLHDPERICDLLNRIRTHRKTPRRPSAA